jgi:two-component system OmpR family sensor kinase
VISVRRRLLLWLLLPVTLVALVSDAVTFFQARDELLGVLDRDLEAWALALAAGAAPEAMSSPGGREVRIWDANGQPAHAASGDGPPRASGAGASTAEWQGRQWRTFVVQRGERTIQVAEPLEPWRARADRTAVGIIMPFSVAVVPVFALLVWLGVGRGLRPLTEIAAALDARRPASLEPLPERGVPGEILPMVQALNDLLRRLGDALESERRFIADAAHELRTPLTAVQLQVENLARVRAPAERDAAIGQLKAGVARAGHLVQQLLALARLSHEDATERRFAPTDLEAVVRGVLVEQQQLAEHRRIDLGLAHLEPVRINADAEGIRVMLGNLVGNALRYTPEGGVVDVRLYRNGAEGVIEVEDTGPGIPAKDREQVFRRFQRGASAGVSGSGLGLAIVREVVTRHRGTVELGDSGRGGGLTVKVRLPIATGAH